MRRSLAIFFLSVILLNIAGYYLVMEGWKWHNSITWSIDDNDSESHSLIVEIPLNVPYTQEKDWESANGQFEYQGDVYRIVKQKITLDAVFIACVKDVESNLINSQLEDFVKTFTDNPTSGKESTKSFPGFIKEFISQSVSVKELTTGWSQTMEYILLSQSKVPSFPSSIVHPPERIA